MFVNTNFSHISRAHISISKGYFNAESSTYHFHMKAKVLVDFQICISVPLTYRSFTFNLRFSYARKHKVRLSKNVCGICHLRFRFVFIKVYILVQQNAWTR